MLVHNSNTPFQMNLHSVNDKFHKPWICHMPIDCQTFLNRCSPLKRDHVTKGGRSMDGWTYYGGVGSFPKIRLWFEKVQATGPSGGPATAPLRLCESRSLLAEPLSGSLHILQRITSPAPSHRHMDHLNDLSTKSLAIDVEAKEKQWFGQ